MKKIGLLILAAGHSTRLGRPKQMLNWRGETLLDRTVRNLNNLDFQERVIVLPESTKIYPTAFLGLTIRIPDSINKGMGNSIRVGLKPLANRVEGVLITLCDLPHITAIHYTQLFNRALEDPSQCLASAFADTYGVPAYFPRSLFMQLTNLPANQGGQRLLARHCIRFMPLAEAAQDVDLKSDTIVSEV